MIIRKYGEEAWDEAVINAHLEVGKEATINCYYSDESTNILIESVCHTTGLHHDMLWEEYGHFLVNYLMEIGWDEMLSCISPDLKGFIDNLDSLHYFIDHVVYKANLKGPSFRCEAEEDGSITLHYYSERSGLYPIVKGVLTEVAQQLYNQDIRINVSNRKQRIVQLPTGEKVEEHVIFSIRDAFKPTVPLQKTQSYRQDTNELEQVAEKNRAEVAPEPLLKINQLEFCHIAPYHFVIDKDSRLVQMGKELW
ncbi:unnamed protein product [Bursaphelenchus okinawaensis]|uniref:Heme NO-binding domain-containing protein n=1 Tax=Bursaphelenchus okinawaensis TaxID=465554 RepID=A0A811K132_9BILA|nr:unnamed protein product [Bursaphelenchus okinawaensis]CAG9089644.1 unnamed protein product [Bursaphelenchus okinawaensis]